MNPRNPLLSTSLPADICRVIPVLPECKDDLKVYLDELVSHFNQPAFIISDPISIPHRFSRREDIEIAGFFSAILAWGQRKTILAKMNELLLRMDNAPFDFLLNHTESELRRLEGFVHRTFCDDDLLCFIAFLRSAYKQSGTLEKAFFPHADTRPDAVFHALIRFRKQFVESETYLSRSKKHIASPESGSACKRLNMFFRWMVRRDRAGVDFGIWDSIQPAQLICPCDVHVERQARRLGLIRRPKPDWAMAEELTAALRALNPDDPVRYDFALFGLGIGFRNG